MSKLLTEYVDADGLEVIEEGVGDKKSLYIVGPFIVAEQKNANGRIYRADVLAKEVDRYDREVIQKNKAVGELNHGPTPNINFERASHVVKELRREGNVWVGKAKILDTPMGKIARSLIEEKVPLGVSTRGIGSVTKDHTGTMIVGDDFQLSCIDIVSSPSGPGCWTEGLMESAPDYVLNESGEWDQEAYRMNEEDLNELVEAKVFEVVGSLNEAVQEAIDLSYANRQTIEVLLDSIQEHHDTNVAPFRDDVDAENAVMFELFLTVLEMLGLDPDEVKQRVRAALSRDGGDFSQGVPDASHKRNIASNYKSNRLVNADKQGYVKEDYNGNSLETPLVKATVALLNRGIGRR